MRKWEGKWSVLVGCIGFLAIHLRLVLVGG